ncbi:hypothetical protein D3C77_785770 [compost metagenome]
MHQHVGLVRHRQQRLPRRGLLQVQHDAALVAVQAQENGGQARFLGRSGVPRGVAAGGFDLDHVRAVVGKYL